MVQVSICVRDSDDLISTEFFLGFFPVTSTKAEALFELVKEVFHRFGLPLKKLRGQCYDGASNVSGVHSGLQARIQEIEPRALFVHCNAHNLNLAIQDAMEDVLSAKDFIGVVKDMINFIRISPKRLALFKEIQEEEAGNLNTKIPALAVHCPTRWVMRISSLIKLRANYIPMMKFFTHQSNDRTLDSLITAKCGGFVERMETFRFFFL